MDILLNIFCVPQREKKGNTSVPFGDALTSYESSNQLYKLSMSNIVSQHLLICINVIY